MTGRLAIAIAIMTVGTLMAPLLDQVGVGARPVALFTYVLGFIAGAIIANWRAVLAVPGTFWVVRGVQWAVDGRAYTDWRDLLPWRTLETSAAALVPPLILLTLAGALGWLLGLALLPSERR